MHLDPTSRFSRRADVYAQGRPGYPPEIVDVIVKGLGLSAGGVVADLGSGTGRSCEPFLQAGLAVVGVEPNVEMRAAGDRALARFPAFRSVDGTAEATGLPESSVDLVIAAQAFHWFDPVAAGAEARRILRRPGRAALIWNDRRETGSPFAEGYELLLRRFGTDYLEIRDRYEHEPSIERFFGRAGWRVAVVPNPVSLDYQTLAARLASASYVPGTGEPGHAAMMDALRELFDATEDAGRVVMDHDTRVFFDLLAG